MSRIDELKKDWSNIRVGGQINMFLGVLLVVTTIVLPGKITLSAVTAILGAVVMWLGANDKIEPHPEYQKKLTDFIEME